LTKHECFTIVKQTNPLEETIIVRYDLRILRSLRRIIRSVEIYSKKLASQYQVTGPQLICLLTISDKAPLTATKIAREIHLSPSTVVGVLDRLEEKGLIARQRDKQDRRRVYITLTETGADLVSSAPSPLQDKLADALKALSELEQSTIALALERVVDLMEVRELEVSPILEAGSEID
jgi:DNA-binding MarR family transcriptional regulator